MGLVGPNSCYKFHVFLLLPWRPFWGLQRKWQYTSKFPGSFKSPSLQNLTKSITYYPNIYAPRPSFSSLLMTHPTRPSLLISQLGSPTAKTKNPLTQMMGILLSLRLPAGSRIRNLKRTETCPVPCYSNHKLVMPIN